jgi:hypothetical protein
MDCARWTIERIVKPQFPDLCQYYVRHMISALAPWSKGGFNIYMLLDEEVGVHTATEDEILDGAYSGVIR